MSTASQSLNLGGKAFTGLALLVAVIALFQWAEFLLLYRDPLGMADAFTWTFLTLVAFTPVFAIEFVQNRGD